MPPIELDPIPDPAYPEGSVVGNFDGSGNPYEKQELLHRPHAFALMHGDGGAKVAYGQLLWRYDVLVIEVDSVDGATMEGAGQDAISVFNVKVPTIDDAGGDEMDPTIPNIYHQLDGYGDVYLYWTTALYAAEVADRVDACWVQVGDTPAEDELAEVEVTGNTFDRTAGLPLTACCTANHTEGTYRVKLGAVNENEQVTQNHSSDVFWSTVFLKRIGGVECGH